MKIEPEMLVIDGRLIEWSGVGGELTIPDDVRVICRNAFLGSELEQLTIPEGVTLEANCFFGTGIKRLVIEGRHVDAPNGVFRGLSGLERVIASETVFSQVWKDLDLGQRARLTDACLRDGKCPPEAWREILNKFYPFSGHVKLSDIELLAGLLSLKQKLPPHCLDMLMNELSGDMERTAMLLDYRNRRYSADELERAAGERVEMELGLRERTTAQWREIFTLKACCRGATIMGYLDTEKDLTVPEYIGPNPVIAIHDYAFSDKALERVSIPDSVRRIGTGAFRRNGRLAEVRLGSGVEKICAEAFAHDGIRHIDLPSSLREIHSRAFGGCRSLTGVKLPESLTLMSRYAFCGCDSMREIIIPGSVQKVRRSVFEYCSGLRMAVLGDGITHIDRYAFHGCKHLQAVEIPASVTYIAHTAFSGCPVLRIYAPRDSYAWNYAKQKSIPVTDGSAAESCWQDGDFEVNDGCLERCMSNDQPVVVPEGVTELGSWVFSHARWITTAKDSADLLWGISDALDEDEISIQLPSTLRVIGESAFNNNYHMRKITIPEGVEEIRRDAFKLCSGLEDAELPVGLKQIGRSAFEHCQNLRNINVSESTVIGPAAFLECAGMRDGDGFVIVNGILFSYHGYMDSVVIPDGVHTISERAFESSEINDVTIPASVRRIERFAFHRCKSIRSLTVESEELDVAGSAFHHMELNRLEAPESLFLSLWEKLDEEQRNGVLLTCLYDNRHVRLLAPVIRERWLEFMEKGILGIFESRTDTFVRMLETLDRPRLEECLLRLRNDQRKTAVVRACLQRLAKSGGVSIISPDR